MSTIDRRQEFFRLYELGYSPIPISSGSVRKPLVKDWPQFGERQPTVMEIESWLRSFPDCNIGIPGGLVHIVDIDDETVLRDLAAVLPPTPMGKFCNKGLTAFYRAPGLASHKMGRVLLAENGVETKIPSVEFMGRGGVTTVWGRHGATGAPYRWTGGPVPLAELAELGEAHHHACSDVIYRRYGSRTFGLMNGAAAAAAASINGSTYVHIDARTLAWARAALEGEAAKLADVGHGGRSNQLFSAACALGKWVHHHVLREDEVLQMLTDACSANGLLAEEGPESITAQWRSGLAKSANDTLPTFSPFNGAAPAFTGQLVTPQAPGLITPQAPALIMPPTVQIISPVTQPSRPSPGLIHKVYPVGNPGDFSYLFGMYGSKKSFWAIHRAYCIATGTDFFGHKTTKGFCVFYAAENYQSIHRRLYCTLKHYGFKGSEDDLPLLIIPGFGDLMDPNNVRALIAALQPYINKWGPVVNFTMDTAVTSFRIKEENSPREWIDIEHICRGLGYALGGGTELVHHNGKDASKGGRGSSAIGGSHDFSVTAERQADGTTKVGPSLGDKTRDVADGSVTSICFKLMPYVLDPTRDIYGDPWSNAYAVQCEEVPIVQENRKGLVFWSQAFRKVAVGGRASEPELRAAFLSVYPGDDPNTREMAWKREKKQHVCTTDGTEKFYSDDSPEGMFGPPMDV
jgi:hypothetical protein